MNNIKRGYTTSSIAYLLIGLALLIWPAHSLRLVCYLFGAVILIKGVTSIWAFAHSAERFFFNYFGLVFGVAACALGLFLLVKPDTIVSVLPVLVGIFIILDGLVRLQSALELRRANSSKWYSLLILAGLSAVLGIVIFVNPFKTAEILVMAIGIVLIIEGVLNLGSIFYTDRVLRSVKDLVNSAFDDGDDVGTLDSQSRSDDVIIDVDYEEEDNSDNPQ